MLRPALFILFILSCILCNGQADSVSSAHNDYINLKLSSSSSVIYPGISAGIEFPVRRINDFNLTTKSPSRSYFKRRFVAGNLSWYHHPEFHDNIYFAVEYVMRRTRTGGFTSEFSFGPGYSRTFLSGTTYSVNNNGEVARRKNAGYSYALITAGGGLGYDFSLKKRVPVTVFSKMNIISMFPYNSTLYFRPVLELGIRYSACLPQPGS